MLLFLCKALQKQNDISVRKEKDMKKLIKKVVGSCLLTFMLFSLMGNAVALGNNHTDSEFSFNFYGEELYTVGREKTDTSKMYMKCISIEEDMSYMAHAVGRRTPYSTEKVDCSRGFGYVFEAGVYHYMRNWVYENGYYYGAIAANQVYANRFLASGKWSPDNVNQY